MLIQKYYKNVSDKNQYDFVNNLIQLIYSHKYNLYKSNIILHFFLLDTLGVLARTVGADNFMPLADECIQLGLVC